MKAMVMSALGAANLALREVPEPAPAAGEVLVRIRAAALNFRDLLVLEGKYGSMQKRENLVLLSDGAGEVAVVGSGVTQWKVGDRVVGCFLPDWHYGRPQENNTMRTLGGSVDGVAAEYRVFGENEILSIPPGLNFIEAATLPCAGLTAWNCIHTAHETGAQDIVLTQGTGGVSLFSMQFAKAAGATILATSSSDDKLARLSSLGATHLINYHSDAEWGKTARKITGGRGVDVVVEVGGAGTIKQSIRAARMGGTIALVGVISGAVQELNLPLISMNSLRVIGVAVGSRAQFAEMLLAIERHKIKPVVDRIFPLRELGEALAWLKSGKHLGKVAVEIN
jgi:NADPH:quinone reductase-like Zn-dependent oxidoreductase